MTITGEALTTLRLARGWTQDDLAGLLGVTQPTINRYERDERQPDDDMVQRIADVLGVAVAFLRHAGTLRGAMAIDAHMRRRASAKATVWRRLEARLNEYRMHASMLFEQVSMRAEQIIPTFDPLDTDPEDAARLTRMQWRMPVGPVNNLMAWVEATGCVVITEDFGTPRVDGLSQWIGDHPVVLLNSRQPTDRQRWTLAHELAHLCLHSEFIGDDPEREANTYTAEFTMPAEVIRPQLRNLTTGRLADLKRQWGVSMQALVERAHQLKTITTEQRTNLYKTFSRQGWRVKEPVSDELRPEHPRLTHAIADTLIGKGFVADEVARAVGYAKSQHNAIVVPTRPRLRVL